MKGMSCIMSGTCMEYAVLFYMVGSDQTKKIDKELKNREWNSIIAIFEQLENS